LCLTLTPITPFEIHGVGGNIKVISKGSVRLRFRDSTGAIRDKLLSNAYYAPNCPVRLISIPQLACDTHERSSLCTGGSQSGFTWDGDATTVAHTSPSGVPFLQAYVGNPPHKALYSICNLAHNSLCALSASTMTGSPSPNSDRQDMADLGQVPNLATLPPSEDIDFSEDLDSTIQHIRSLMHPTLQSDKQRDYNSWHYRLGHLSHQRLQELVTLGKLLIRFFARQTRRQWHHRNSHSRSLHDLAASTSGSLTFANQMVSTTPGLIPQSTGKLTKRRFCAATVFVDSHSDYTHIVLQEDLLMDSTLDAKLDYERRTNAFGISIKGYHAENGRFADAAWRDSCFAIQQSFQFCGVGSHHQNGIAERKIRDLSDAARASLLHAIQHWPDGVSKNLWPSALKHACNIRNKVHSKEGRTPEELFAGMPSSSYVDLTQFHPFGCPVYVLDARLQTGNKIPRWEPRSRVGVYLVHLPNHAQSVALILNLSTGHVSPQYHSVYDDDFSTVQSLRLGTVPTNWPDLCSNHRESLTDENFHLSPD
jgi:hypothetical protein